MLKYVFLCFVVPAHTVLVVAMTVMIYFSIDEVTPFINLTLHYQYQVKQIKR